MFVKRSSVINSYHSGQQQFSYIPVAVTVLILRSLSTPITLATLGDITHIEMMLIVSFMAHLWLIYR
jgi:hypothetical protein